MKKIILIIAGLALLGGSCKKNRICECTNSNNTYQSGEYEGTKSQAKKYCEGLSSGATTCYLKD